MGSKCDLFFITQCDSDTNKNVLKYKFDPCMGTRIHVNWHISKSFSRLAKTDGIGIIGDKAYSVQYIADASRYADYLPIVQKMIDSLVIKNSVETGIGPMSDNWKSVMMDYV